MIFQVNHVSLFRYQSLSSASHNYARLKPKEDEGQQVRSFHLFIDPVFRQTHYQDIWDNSVTEFYVSEPHHSLTVRAESIVSVNRNEFNEGNDMPVRSYLPLNEPLRLKCSPFLQQSYLTQLRSDQVKTMMSAINVTNDIFTIINDALDWVYAQIDYNKSSTNVNTSAEQSFDLKSGVCQDKAHMMIGFLRALGIPARYVSGYVYSSDRASVLDTDESHAWVEGYVPGYGWVGFDPTNGERVLNHHIRVACGRDYLDVSPLKGTYKGSGNTITVSVKIEAL
ncbi:transglutaminase domain-containing protein [Shouchella sp. JSM 1781072]|uniref:transglutaminase family protein n=1 Tax=Bacillaceae TaxID=186817 RepID=UPI000C07D452|nr:MULTISPECIES: transglutaminase family protein [Bacillaceae]UTR04632.1 transglutaminase family protein [Alkalihalobacillus sp. LMS6]